ncbi:MAG: DUF2254 family protein [Myxococcota bacterium]
MDDDTRSSLRIWLLPLLILLSGALAVFVFTFLVDSEGQVTRLRLLYEPNPMAAANTISSAGEVVAAVLGIAITVVAIIVELASNRYTHRVTELFISEPINFFVMGFFVITALQAVFVTITFDVETVEEAGQVIHAASGFVPYLSLTVALAMLALCLLVLLPYFAFVFEFLSPIQIVDRIRRYSLRAITRRATEANVRQRQLEAIRGVEQLADVGLNAMENKDKGVSMASVDALRAMATDYQDIRDGLGSAWFRIEGELAHNPDFVSMSPDVLSAVTRRRIWFEMKVLRKYQTLYNEALNKMRDINYLIAINTRLIAEHALDRGNDELFELVVKFYNTFLRSTVNARDVRTAYNVLNQYRILAERCLDVDKGRPSVEIARYFKYYGLVSFHAKLPFILETVAYDLCALNELAHDQGSPVQRELLRIFLQVDKESESAIQEVSLRGVRKAQCKLATHYLVTGAEHLAREIYRDMETERHDRLASIRDELLGVQSAEFWEISDRGVNFDYLSPARKRELLTFFSWFEDLPEPSLSILPTDPGELPEPTAAEVHVARGQRAPRHSEDDATLHEVPGAGADPKVEAR